MKIIIDKLNINNEDINNKEQIIKLIFEELSQYKNIKISDFFESASIETIKIYNSIFKSNNYIIINNLKEINFLFDLSNKKDLNVLNKLISINNITNKLKLTVNLNKFFTNLTGYDAINKIILQLQLGKEAFTNLILPKKLKALDIDYPSFRKNKDIF